MRDALLSLALRVAVCAALSGCAARSPASQPTQPLPEPTDQDIINEFQGDRPDVANATHIVPVALAQLETGGEWDRVDAGSQAAGMPISLRVGLHERVEARIESDGVSYQKDPGGSSWTFNGLSLGAKIRFSDAFGILPAVNLPVGGQTGTDYRLTLMTSADFGGRNHVDANYGLAASGVGDNGFFQQWAAVSVQRQVTDAFVPYAELDWFSRQDPGGGGVAWTGGGFVYTVSERLAFDAGMTLGLTSAAPTVRLFAGLTTILGEVHGHRGVHGRLRDAASRR